MNHYTLKDIRPGMEESFEVTITEEMLDAFTFMSGDIYPMHLDGRYAKENGYKDRIVYGMCTASLYSTLAGVYLPGERCLLRECNVRWSLPVYIGDRLFVHGKVTEIDERFRSIVIMAEIKNQDGKMVSHARIVAVIQEGK